jgi:hypothetical protein
MSTPDKDKKPSDYDEEFAQAVARFREQHKLSEDDAVFLLVELFRIHQQHWDNLRRREMPSFEQFRTDIGALTEAAATFRQLGSNLIDTFKKQASTQNRDGVNLAAAIFAVLAALIGGYLIGKAGL